MKIIIIIIAFFFSFSSIYSEDYVNETLLCIAAKLIEKPDRIFDLKNNFPDNYNEKYLHKMMKDTTRLRECANYIDSLFQRKYAPSWIGIGGDFEVYNGQRRKIDKKNDINKKDSLEIESIWINKNNYGFMIEAIIENNIFYIRFISKSYPSKDAK